MLSATRSMSNDLAGREWRFYIADMIGFCERVLSFNVAISREEFSTDPMRRWMSVRPMRASPGA